MTPSNVYMNLTLFFTMCRGTNATSVAMGCDVPCELRYPGHPGIDMLVYAFRCMCFKQFASNSHAWLSWQTMCPTINMLRVRIP